MAVKHVVRTERAPAPFQGAPYSQGIVFGDLVWVSGQVAIDPASGNVVEGGISEQTEQVMQNVSAILEEAGSGLKQLVKTTIFLADFDDFQAMNEVYARHVGPEPPARATVQVAYLPSGVLVEIDALAHL
ncbi:MAG TPA: Rid family detoxifying hydrolase [Gaiella sp.]|jgi:2-iminobutanoate/2-iminopropanoate deaminase